MDTRANISLSEYDSKKLLAVVRATAKVSSAHPDRPRLPAMWLWSEILRFRSVEYVDVAIVRRFRGINRPQSARSCPVASILPGLQEWMAGHRPARALR